MKATSFHELLLSRVEDEQLPVAREGHPSMAKGDDDESIELKLNEEERRGRCA